MRFLAGLGVFLSKNLKAHDHGIASHPSNNSDDTEEKQSGDHGSSPLRQRGTSGQGQNGMSEARAERIPMREREKMSAVKMTTPRKEQTKPGEAVPERIRGCAPLLHCAELHGAVCRPSAIQGLL